MKKPIINSKTVNYINYLYNNKPITLQTTTNITITNARLMRQSDSVSSPSSSSPSDVTSQTSALRGEDSTAIDELLAAYKMSLDTNCCDEVSTDSLPRDQTNMADLVALLKIVVLFLKSCCFT